MSTMIRPAIRVLLPCLALSLAAACGGTSVGGDPNGQGADHAGAGSVAGAAGSIPNIENPPPNNWTYGGQGGGGYGGVAGHAGGGPNPPIVIEAPCPDQVPTEGSSCSSANAACSYPWDCGLQWAVCDGVTWDLSITADTAFGCGGDGGAGPDLPPPPPVGPLTCPYAIPQQNEPCYLPGNIARYDCEYSDCAFNTVATCSGTWNVSKSFAHSGYPGYAGCGAI